MSKVYKIKYQLNLLPQIGEHVALDPEEQPYTVNQGQSFMSLLKETSELNMF